MSWTGPAELEAQVRKLWDRGQLLAALCDDQPLFPRSLTLKAPSSRDLSERFPEVRAWIARLAKDEGHYRLEWRSVQHRVIGANEVPSAVWIDSLEQALTMIGKRSAAKRFATLLELTRAQAPDLLPFLARRALRALELAEDWPQLLAVVNWLRAHPRPGVYLRQLDLPGVHTKLIEQHRGVLQELLDLVLPAEAIDPSASGIAGFCRRYGFRDKPTRVRFRLLDPDARLLPGVHDQDLTVSQEAFAELNPPVSRVFITENEVNFLAFPPMADALVVFGAGYGFSQLATAGWLHRVQLHYWGDIDTHGFAILDQLRGHFPHTVAMLMDEPTLLAHRRHWVQEPNPEQADLTRLTAAESQLYEGLRSHRWGERLRLEQERIGYETLNGALLYLPIR